MCHSQVDKTISQSQSVTLPATHKRVLAFDDMPTGKMIRLASGGHFCPLISAILITASHSII